MLGADTALSILGPPKKLTCGWGLRVLGAPISVSHRSGSPDSPGSAAWGGGSTELPGAHCAPKALGSLATSLVSGG